MNLDDKKELQRLKEEVKRLQKIAYKDELTDLYNRHGFQEWTERFLSELKWRRKHSDQRSSLFIKSFSIVIFDIDDFKKINDSFGHDIGDEVLISLGKIVFENVRDIDLAARWGGEEIVLGLVGANEKDAVRIADRIRKHVSELDLQLNGKTVSFTVSGGVVGFEDAEDFDDMIRLADKALYQAKSGGKNRIVKYSDLK